MNGIIHAHSRYSYDGTLSLEELRRLFISQGLQFACMTEHTDGLDPADAERFITACRATSDERFVFVPGFEVPYLGNHTLVVGTDRYYEGESALARWAADGALLIQAHPHRNGYRTDDFLREHLNGVEVWNSQYDGIHAPRLGARILHRQLATGRPMTAYGALDLHRASHINGPRLELDARPDDSLGRAALTEKDILTALRESRFHIRRGGTVLDARGAVIAGGAFRVGVLGMVMPPFIACMRLGSSLLHHLGIRTFPLKRWMRKRV